MRPFQTLPCLALVPLAICSAAGAAVTTHGGAAGTTAALTGAQSETNPQRLSMAGLSGNALLNAAYLRNGRNWEPLMFLCDGVYDSRVAVVTVADAKGTSWLRTYSKPGFAARNVEVRVGDDDPGAGQIMRSLRRPDGAALGSVHSINPGVLGSAEVATLPTLSSITVGSEITRCRWAARARVLFIDSRRTVLITAVPGAGYTYLSFDHAKPGAPVGGNSSIANAKVGGGHLIRSQSGVETYEFKNNGWTYRLTASSDHGAPGATLEVIRAGRMKARTSAVTYEMAAARQ